VVVADHKVIQHLHAEKLAGVVETLRELTIVGAWSRARRSGDCARG
jgi:hypothetical protein